MSGSWSEGQSYDQIKAIGTMFAFGLVELTAWDLETLRLLCKQKQLFTQENLPSSFITTSNGCKESPQQDDMLLTSPLFPLMIYWLRLRKIRKKNLSFHCLPQGSSVY